jgi:predicted DNA-binding protein
MRDNANKAASTLTDNAQSIRASISFPQELYETLTEIARQKKVSLAWVVREAAEQYIADKWPLFKGRK